MRNISSQCPGGLSVRHASFLLLLATLLTPFASLPAQRPNRSFRFEPDLTSMEATLASAKRVPGGSQDRQPAVAHIALPDPTGLPLPLLAQEVSMLAPEFAARYPDFKFYNLTDPASGRNRGRLFTSRYGLQALVFSENGAFSIRPVERGQSNWHEAQFETPGYWTCAGDIPPESRMVTEAPKSEAIQLANGATYYTYRLAVVTTGEYFQANGGTLPLADAAVAADVSNLVAIFQPELSIGFTLLTPLHYTDPATDPFFPDESNGVTRASQAAAVIGAGFSATAYDVGHVFHAGNSGGAAVRSTACNNTVLADPDGPGNVYTTGGVSKGRGWSGYPDNVSLGFSWVLAHEMGHMFGARHTFNGSGGDCTADIDPISAYEIGSGSTLMSYVEGCGPGQQIAYTGTADHYFHSKSLEQIINYINTAGNCAETTPSGNQPPSVAANPCGTSPTIPISTPFSLNGSGSDPDGNTVYFGWEEIDEDGPGVPTQGLTGAGAGNNILAPLFRSYPPVVSPTRTFPAMPFILNDSNAAAFEALPNVGRTLHFRLQARDFQSAGGTDYSDLAVGVNGAAGPFLVTAPNGGETWSDGVQTVTWSVNGTAALCAQVRIRMSVDGGVSFPILLAENTPNDGSATVTLPAVASSPAARIQVECPVNNCLTFFDISNANFTFNSSCLAQASVFSPTDALSFVVGDPGLNLPLQPVYNPVPGYDYAFLALNINDQLIAAVSPNAAFTTLPPGAYQVYGIHYKSTGATPPNNADPNNFVGQRFEQLLEAAYCFQLSSTLLSLTVTLPPPLLVINEIDYRQGLTDDAEFIELKNVANTAVDLSGWTLELVDGTAGAASVYRTIALPGVSLPAGGYFVVCGNSAKVANCNLEITPTENFIQNLTPAAVGLRWNGALRDAVSYDGNTGAPYTENTGEPAGDDGVQTGQGMSRFPDGVDTDHNANDFTGFVCITPGGPNVNSMLAAFPIVTGLSCFGSADGTVALSVSGGSPGYSYQWSNNQSSAFIEQLGAGTYSATVTDAYGCAATAVADVPQPPELAVSAISSLSGCAANINGAVALSVSGGVPDYTFAWSNGATAASISGIALGTYTATVTDANGCTGSASATLVQPTGPLPSDLCSEACPACFLNGYSGSTLGFTQQAVPGFCGTVENDQWFRFVASDTMATFTATPSNCINENGVQIALFPDCEAAPIACNSGMAAGGTTPVSITASMIPGQTYFLMIDGWAGDVCNFSLAVTPEPTVPVQAAIKVYLQGPYVSAAQLMHDSLRVKGLIPLTEPYTGLLNFIHLGGGGGEQTTPAVLAVSGPDAIVDWVFLELRSATDPAVVLATRSALLQRDGDVVAADGVSMPEFAVPAGQSYYLAVRHRNHLGVELGAVKLFPGCTVPETDFRELPPEGFFAFNGLNAAQKVIGGKYLLWAGNGRIDFQLKYNGSNNDRNAVLSVVGLNTPNAIVPGYKVEDYNLDGVVKYNGSVNDRNVLLGNVGIATPSAVVFDQVAR